MSEPVTAGVYLLMLFGASTVFCIILDAIDWVIAAAKARKRRLAAEGPALSNKALGDAISRMGYEGVNQTWAKGDMAYVTDGVHFDHIPSDAAGIAQVDRPTATYDAHENSSYPLCTYCGGVLDEGAKKCDNCGAGRGRRKTPAE